MPGALVWRSGRLAAYRCAEWLGAGMSDELALAAARSFPGLPAEVLAEALAVDVKVLDFRPGLTPVTGWLRKELDVEAMAAEYEALASSVELSERYGVAPNTVLRHLRWAGVTIRPAEWALVEGHRRAQK